jgi:hypothetical protein
MKRLPQTQVDRIAGEVVRMLICRYGERNLDRLTLAIRRQAREQTTRPLGVVK